MTCPCEVGLVCVYRCKDGVDCFMSWDGYLPDRCPMVRTGSPLEAYLSSYADYNGRSSRWAATRSWRPS